MIAILVVPRRGFEPPTPALQILIRLSRLISSGGEAFDLVAISRCRATSLSSRVPSCFSPSGGNCGGNSPGRLEPGSHLRSNAHAVLPPDLPSGADAVG